MLYRVLTVLALAFSCAGPAFADPTGNWLDKDGTILRVEPCGQAMCATIVSMNPPLDPATRQPWTDKHNSDATKRGRPLIGVQVLTDMMPNGASKWSGQLYDSDHGNTLLGNLIELGPNRIRIEGCMMGLCGGEELRRVAR